MSPRCVFVTGATGYIGRALIPALLARGHTVRAGAQNQRETCSRRRGHRYRRRSRTGYILRCDCAGRHVGPFDRHAASQSRQGRELPNRGLALSRCRIDCRAYSEGTPLHIRQRRPTCACDARLYRSTPSRRGAHTRERHSRDHSAPLVRARPRASLALSANTVLCDLEIAAADPRNRAASRVDHA